ncbi:MAG: helicase-related protein [Bacteroidales bacterium]|jgi:hypothetical protein
MSYLENRNKIIDRIEKELIGPGSDIFLCDADFSNEIIEGKPLQRYFSAILFPKQIVTDDSETGKGEFIQDDDNDSEIDKAIITPSDEDEKEKSESEDDVDEEPDTVPKSSSNAFFPSHFGFSFSVNKSCSELNLIVSFGNYKKAKAEEIILHYTASDLNLLTQFGFDQFVTFDEKAKTLRQRHEIKRKKKGKVTTEYLLLQSAFKSMSADHRNSAIFKHLTKLFFKDKYKRFKNEIPVDIKIADLLNTENNHIEINLSNVPNVNSDNWHKDNKDNLVLHLKLHNTNADKYFIKAVIENKFAHKKDQFALSKEKLNQLALFQTEIKVNSNFLLPFRDYRPHLYKTAEDKMLDYLFKNKLAYGIGHNTSCTWENCEQDESKPSWIKTTFIPSYNVKNQSTETDKIANEILNIKNLSSFGNDKNKVISNLQKIADAYLSWIKDESGNADDNEYGEKNIQKCKEIHRRIEKGIQLLSQNDNAYKAFQLANTAIYIQMFQSEWHFNKKDGFEVFERNGNMQLTYNEYSTANFPNGKGEPSWRPFQLAFILQCIPSFVEPNSTDKDLVDLLYFPTGGGKTEAYLAISAFLIFWRRVTFPKQYDGVNIIIRYTLRLLSAQQFERATKLILACEFIRQHQKDLGSEKISIGFWIGKATIPNSIKIAKEKYNFLLKKLNDKNFDGRKAINPFQLTNCQWCNSKIISRINNKDATYSVGHRINNHLQSHCLNPKCNYNETKGGLPLVLVDDDIYHKPPTILFGTVDKFASLAWNGEATTLFNYGGNRKPELIIQDELHLLNGPLGSLVGLFENVILSLCTNENQKPKIIASTATVKNVEAQIQGLYGREARIFPQYATNSDDTFFSKTLEESKRKYIGILPTGKTTVMTNLQLLSALLYARIEIWEQSADKKDADQFWTLLSYFKSLKEIGRFSNKISSELKPIIQQLQVRRLKNQGDLTYNYWKLSYRNLELTSRIPNERIKKNLDKLDIQFDGSLKEHKAYDLVLATNMISVGLDVGRLGIMVMNGMPPNTAEYIQASSRVARKNEGLVTTMFDPFNTRDLSYFEDFVQFHKTFYKQVEPLSVTPFADSALDKMLFTLMVAYFRHKMNFAANNMANAFMQTNAKTQLQNQFPELFRNHPFVAQELSNIILKIEYFIQNWQYRVDAVNDLKFFWYQHPEKSLMKSVQDKRSEDDILVAMQSMRNVEPNAEIFIKQQ